MNQVTEEIVLLDLDLIEPIPEALDTEAHHPSKRPKTKKLTKHKLITPTFELQIKPDTATLDNTKHSGIKANPKTKRTSSKPHTLPINPQELQK